MSAANKQKARDYLAAIFAVDRKQLETLAAADVKLWVPRSALKVLPISNPIVGRDRVVDFLVHAGTTLFDHSAPTFDVHHTIAEGDLVVVHFTLRTNTRAGMPYENDYAFLVRFDGGMIAECWEYTDTAHAFAKFAETGKGG